MICDTSEQRITEEVARMGRDRLVYELLHFRGSAPLDFTEQFLADKSVEHLRHILVAAKLHLN